jgi:hypothetical protein
MLLLPKIDAQNRQYLQKINGSKHINLSIADDWHWFKWSEGSTRSFMRTVGDAFCNFMAASFFDHLKFELIDPSTSPYPALPSGFTSERRCSWLAQA